jgi:hypothetical protein
VYEQEGTTPGQSPSTGAAKVERRFVGTPADPAAHTEPTTDQKADPGWNKLLLVVGAIAVVVALLVVPGILNRGGKNPVADAAEATSNSPGVQFTFNGRAQGPAAISMSGKGAMNGETNRVSIEMSATGSTPAGTQGFSLQEVLDDGDLYLHSPELGAAFGGSGRWLLMRSEALGDLLQGNASGAGMSASPTQQLDALEDASHQVAEVGPEQVNGVATTHYRALIDVDKLTHANGLLRREASTSSMGALGSFTMTMDFSRYGSQPDIQVPQGPDVFDATPLMQNALDELDG